MFFFFFSTDWQYFGSTYDKSLKMFSLENNMPQQSPQLYDDCTLKSKIPFWNNKHLKPAHYMGDIVSSKASLNSS